jgi:cyclic pyranopterin phosphate synthase
MTTSRARPTVSLRLSVTEHCQLGCLYCRPASGSSASKCARASEPISFDDIAYFVELIQNHFSLSKVHLTGGEPLLRPNLAQLIRLLADQKLDFALTTNAQCLEKHASPLKQAGLKRVNVSLDSLNPTTFANMTRGGDVQRTLAGIQKAKEVQLQPIKLNMTVLRGLNDHEITDVAHYGLRTGCEVRFLELMPIGPAQDRFDQFFVSAAEVHERLTHTFALKPIESKPGQSARRYLARDAQGQKGVLGQIAPYTHPFCQGCRRLRLTSTGQLITCLASGRAIDLSQWLRQRGPRSERIIREIVTRELDAKCMRGPFDTSRSMVAVGG